MSAVKLDIEKIVERLLHHYECVILPDFGGFIIRDSPCNFNVAKDQLKPYGKHIFFNPHLVQNDGLLYNEIQKNHQLSYQESISEYQSWLLGIKQIISEAGSKHFGNLGTFYKGNENSVWFSPLSTLNLAMDSYGLFPVDVRQVFAKEAVPEAHVKEELVAEEEQPVMTLADNTPIKTLEPAKLNYKGWLVAASVALIAHIGYLQFEKKDVTVNEASVIPVIENKTNPVDAAKVADSATIVPTPMDTITAMSTEKAIEDHQSIPVTPEPAPAVENPVISQPQTEQQAQASTPADTAAKAPLEAPLNRVAKYKIEENANNHRKDLEKKGIKAQVRLNGEWYEVLTEEPIQ
jgi:hypothetical protein